MRGAAATRGWLLPERFGGQMLPAVEAIDLRAAPPPRGRFISPVLAEAVKIALERREQALLFLKPPRLRTADFVPRLRLPLLVSELRTPGWSITVSASSWSAIIAASPRRIRKTVRNARRRIHSSPAGRRRAA